MMAQSNPEGPLVVVAVLQAKPGLGPRIIEHFREVAPLVHQEPGCELYAAHLQQGGDAVVMVERWSSPAALAGHASGAALARLNELNEGMLEKPYDVWRLDNVPLGDPAKATIPPTTEEP